MGCVSAARLAWRASPRGSPVALRHRLSPGLPLSQTLTEGRRDRADCDGAECDGSGASVRKFCFLSTCIDIDISVNVKRSQ